MAFRAFWLIWSGAIAFVFLWNAWRAIRTGQVNVGMLARPFSANRDQQPIAFWLAVMTMGCTGLLVIVRGLAELALGWP